MITALKNDTAGVGVAPWVKRAKPADKEGMLQKQGVKLLS